MLASFIQTDAIAAGDAVQISAVTPADSHDPVIYPIGIIKNMTTHWRKTSTNT